MTQYYLLDDNDMPVTYTGTFDEWVEKWEDMKGSSKHPFQQAVCKNVWVSTTFVGYSSLKLYETMVFGGSLSGKCAYSSDKEQARAIHDEFVYKVKESEGLNALDNIKKQHRNSRWAF